MIGTLHYTPSFATDNGPVASHDKIEHAKSYLEKPLDYLMITIYIHHVKKLLNGIVPVKGDRNYALHTQLRHRQWFKCFKTN